MSEWSFITAQHFFRAYSVSGSCWPPKWWRCSSWEQRLCICQVVSFSLYSADQTELRSMEKKGLWKILYLYIHCPPIEWNSLSFSCECSDKSRSLSDSCYLFTNRNHRDFCNWAAPWVRKIQKQKEWQPTPVFSPEESHGQRSLAGWSPWDRKESTWLSTNTFTFRTLWSLCGSAPLSPISSTCLLSVEKL